MTLFLLSPNKQCRAMTTYVTVHHCSTWISSYISQMCNQLLFSVQRHHPDIITSQHHSYIH